MHAYMNLFYAFSSDPDANLYEDVIIGASPRVAKTSQTDLSGSTLPHFQNSKYGTNQEKHLLVKRTVMAEHRCDDIIQPDLG